MEITDSTQFKLSDQQIASDLGGEKVILNHQKGAYFGLGEVGAFVWDCLTSAPRSIDELTEAVSLEYEVEKEVAKTDIRDLIRKLSSERLIQPV